MNSGIATTAALWIILTFFLIGIKSLSSASLPNSHSEPVSVSDINVYNELVTDATNNEVHQEDYNITKTHTDNYVHCYDECFNITDDDERLDCKSAQSHSFWIPDTHECVNERDPNNPCNMSCWYELERILESCPFILDETKDYIDSVKFWLDGILKVFISLRYGAK